MSIEQPIDPQLIEQTKQQIRSLVGEIAQLAKTNVAPEEFYGQFLPRVVSALAAVGGAVWTVNPEGQLALQYQINLQETHLRENEEHQAQHSRLLYKALSSGEALLVPPHSGPGDVERVGDETPAANPTEFLLLLGLLKTDLETMGLVEIFQRSDSSPTTQQGYLRFLIQMCELAGDFLKSHQLRHFSDRQTLWTQLEDFTRAVHASLDPREAAYTIANEGRRLIECDRVSVAIRKGKKCYIEAISGQDLFDKRSNTVRLLGKLATAVVAGGDPVWYTGDTRDMAPQVEDAVQEYVDEAHSKTVAIMPLRRPPPLEEDDPKKRVAPEAPIGALIVEQIEDSRVTASLTHRADVVCKHSSTALANALEHQNLFLMPVWRTLGKTRWVLEARTLPKTLSIAGGVLLVLLILGLWPASFTIESKGTLQPVERRNVFAGIDGEIQDIPAGVDGGKTVSMGQLLVQLRSSDAQIELTRIQGERLAAIQQLLNVGQELRDERLKREERIRMAGKQAELKQTLAALDDQLGYCKAKQKQLEVRSPINGEIVTWDLRKLLPLLRPVHRGERLIQLADPAGPWELELHMPENRMGHITKYQQGLYEKSREMLRQRLREDVQDKLGEEASDEDVDKAVETELAGVPDQMLREKTIALLYNRLRKQAESVLNDNAADESLRAKLGEVLRETTYDGAKAKLLEALPDVGDDDLKARLRAAATLPDVPDDQLDVTYVLATEAGTRQHGTVKEIHNSAEIRGDEGNTVLIKVELDPDELEQLRKEKKFRSGASVNAKVYCGRRPLGYVLLHDLIEFVQARVLFKFF